MDRVVVRRFEGFPSTSDACRWIRARFAQEGGKHLDAKPLKGFRGSGVLEAVEDFDGDTFRAVIQFVLHCFQKKSKSGVSTPKQEMDLVNRRLKTAEQEHSE